MLTTCGRGAGVLRATGCASSASTATRTSGQGGYPHAGTGMFAFYNWGGSNGGGSSKVVRLSDLKK